MNFSSTFKTILKGLLIGASAAIPGINATTSIALTGLYDNTILSLRHLNHKKSWSFLLIIGCSILAGILLLSPLVDTAITNYPRPAYLFLMGLIIGALPRVFYHRKKELRPTLSKLLIFAIFCGILLALHFSPDISDTVSTPRQVTSLLFLSGIISGITLIIPGTTSSIPLTIMGSYQLLHETIQTLSPSLLLLTIPGILIGLILSILLMSLAITHYRAHTHYAILGLLVGILPKFWPGLAPDFSSLIAILLGGIGIAIGYHLQDPA